jgi:hypothetical protein
MAMLAVTSGSSVFAEDTEEYEGKLPFVSDWLNIDLAMVKATRPVLAEPFMGLNQFLQRLHAGDTRMDRSIAPGLRQIHLTKSGGYTMLWIYLVAHDDEILAIQCIQQGDPDWWSRIVPQLLKAWKKTSMVSGDTRITVTRYVNQAKLDEILARTLGPQPKVSPEASLKESFDVLVAPFEVTDVGEKCYYSGIKPTGRVAMDTLCASQRYDLMRAILRGPNPEGRTYAALALLEHDKVDSQDATVIQKLKSLSIPIQVCRGCIVSRKKFADIIAATEAKKAH